MRGEEVVLRLDGLGEGAQLLLRQPQQQRTTQDAARGLLEGGAPEPGAPALLEGDALLDVVQRSEARQAGFERVRPQQAEGESVDRLDGGEVDLADRLLAARQLVGDGLCIVGRCFRRISDAVA